MSNVLLLSLAEKAVNHVEELDARLVELTNDHINEQRYGSVSLSTGSVWFGGSGPFWKHNVNLQGQTIEPSRYDRDDGDLREILFACRRFATALHNEIKKAEIEAGKVEQWAAELK